MKTLHIYIAVLFMALTGASANASVYFVNGSTGSNLYDGSSPNHSGTSLHGPKKTISVTIALASAGDDIYIANSNYNETVVITKNLNFHTSSNVQLSALTMNGSGVNLSLDGNIYVNNTITFTNGYIVGDSNSMPIVNYTTTQVGGSKNSFTYGPFGVRIASSYTHRILSFPVGKDTTYRPMQLDMTTGDAHTTTFIGEVINQSPAARCTPASESITNVSTVRYWNLTSTCICVKEGKITLGYGSDDGVDTTQSIIVKDDQEVNIGCWQNLHGAITGTRNFGTITSTCRFTGCGTFTLGNVDAATSALPVTWLSFDLNKVKPNLIKLTWATASEVNNDYFTIERSTDPTSKTWMEVCRVPGHGTSNQVNSYTCNDSTVGVLNQTVYYRPKQVDFNGAFEYYNVIKLHLELGGTAIESVYPNPASDRINVRYTTPENGVVTIRLTSLEGKTILSSKYNVTPGTQTVDIDLPEDNLAKGVYMLEVESGGQVSRHKIIKQ
jgi:hypothetical protein